MAGPIDGSLRKFHASLNVSDLDRSIAFYRTLFGTEPAKVKANYAKFDISEPPLVLSLIPGHAGAGGNLNHVGLRVRTAEELVEIQRRLEEAGMPTRREDGVSCCYARQTKFWISDPDRALWEVYVFHEDLDEHGDDHAPQVETVAVVNATRSKTPIVWEHRIADPVPARIPHDDNSVHEVHLEGTVNVRPDAPNRAALLAEAFRVLRPSAVVHLHGLAGDRACDADLDLPGPAAAVRHVPAVAAVIDEVVRAGFVDVDLETLSSTAYFVVDGVPMRELRVRARKPGHRTRTATHQAVYLGPLRQVTDDLGNVFERGALTPLNVHDWQLLSKSSAAADFLLIAPDANRPDRARTESASPPTAAPQVETAQPAR